MSFRPPLAADARAHEPAAVFEAGLRNHHVSNTAYPIEHKRTFWPYRVQKTHHARVVRRGFSGVRDLGLYAHVPFCETRCAFCEYTVVRRSENESAGRYVDDLLREMRLYADLLGDEPRRIRGFDIGGGTPAFLEASAIERIAHEARTRFRFSDDAGISIETTPRIAAAFPDRLRDIRAAGIDRISMGIQVTEPDLLRVLNRGQNGAEHLRRAADHIHGAGFERFNVDLMYGFAGQDEAGLAATIDHAVALDPDAITLYRMRYKLTRISDQASSVTLSQVRVLHERARRMLKARGYHANPGMTTYSRRPGETGTSRYIEHRVRDAMPYLGLGLGAQTFSNRTISYNDGALAKNLAPYERSLAAGRLPIQDLYDLPLRHVAGKVCAVSFYFGEIDRRGFERRIGAPLEHVFAAEVQFVVERGLMEWTERSLRLTEAGARDINGVVALFFAPSIQTLLVERDPARAQDMDRNRRLAEKVAGGPHA